MSNKLISPKLLRWLTFYLLVALIILLLYANLLPSGSSASGAATKTPAPTSNISIANAKATATAAKATATAAQATATAAQATSKNLLLDNQLQDIPLPIVDYQKLIANDPREVTMDMGSLVTAVHKSNQFNNRRAALVIVYVEVSDNNQLDNAKKMAQNIIMNILMQYDTAPKVTAQDKDLFSEAKYQTVVFMGTVTDENGSPPQTNGNLSQVDLRIFLYASK